MQDVSGSSPLFSIAREGDNPVRTRFRLPDAPLADRTNIQLWSRTVSAPRGIKAFDGQEGSGINANNIVAFERVAVAA